MSALPIVIENNLDENYTSAVLVNQPGSQVLYTLLGTLPPVDSRTEAAVRELQQLILRQYPQAAFEVTPVSDNPESTNVAATIDLEDTDEVLDPVIDRLFALQVEKHLPVHVIPVRPSKRGGGAPPMRQPSRTGRSRLAALVTSC